MAEKKKFYAVARGRKPGIYTEWFGPTGAEAQVRGFPGARYKGFATRAEARSWLKSPAPAARPETARDAAVPARRTDDRAGRIQIFTDGGSINNPGPGGYGIVILNGDERREISGGFRWTTNNRMELMGCIVALSQFEEPARILLRTDSLYVVNGITKGWAARWRRNAWMRTPEEPAENSDLWERLLELTEKHDVLFEWLRGHAGHCENERCDFLARAESAKKNLPPDTAYEQRRAAGRR
ncbi:MAG: ribonuclease HI [bacterium]